jgi:hypothetical protein
MCVDGEVLAQPATLLRACVVLNLCRKKGKPESDPA